MGQIGNILTGAMTTTGSGGGGGGVTKVDADNGVSLDPASTVALPVVVLGDDGGGQAAFTDDRFIEMAGNRLVFTNSFAEAVAISPEGVVVENGGNYVYRGNDTQSLVMYGQDSRDGFMRIQLQNLLATPNAGVGMLLENDLGHIFQHYLSSSLTDPPYIPDTALLRTNASKLSFHSDSGKFYFGQTPAFDAPDVSLQSFASGNWIFQPNGFPYDSFADDGNLLQVQGNISVRNSGSVFVYDDADNTIYSEVANAGFYTQDSGGVDIFTATPTSTDLSSALNTNVQTAESIDLQNVSTGDDFNVSDTDLYLRNLASNDFTAHLTKQSLQFSDAADNFNSAMTESFIQFDESSSTIASSGSAELWTVGNAATGAHADHLFDRILVSDNNANTDATALLFSTYLQIADNTTGTHMSTLSSNRVSFDDSATNDFGILGYDSLELADGVGGNGAQLTKNNFQVNAPSAFIGSFLTEADIYGSLATINPVTGNLDTPWQFGGVVAGAAVLDAGNYVSVLINGVAKKLALVV